MQPPDALPNPTFRRTYKYRIYPTAAQVVALDEQLGAGCDLYNAALEQRRQAWRENGVSIGYYEQCRELTEARREGLLPNGMSAQAQQRVLRRLDRAFAAFYRRCKTGERPGYPRFRSRARYDSLTWSCGPGGSGCRIRSDGRLVIQGVGSVRIRWHRPLRERSIVKEAHVRRRGSQWYVCFSCVVPLDLSVHNGREVGLDLGVRNFVALSTGETVPGLRSKTFRRAARRVSRRKRGSNRRRKAVALLARQRQRDANRRRDFHHKLSRRLVDEFSLIVVENLAVKQMRRSAHGTIEKPGHNVRAKAGLNRRMAEQGWSQFLSFLDYKAEEAGSRIVKVDPRKTSQTCSNCGAISRSKSEVRRCECGLELDRDVNAAINILRLGRSLRALTVEEEARAVARKRFVSRHLFPIAAYEPETMRSHG